MSPEVGQVVTGRRHAASRSRLRPEALEQYGDDAGRIAALARTMPGYVEHKAYTADDGERVTLVTFADRATHQGWRDHPEHRAAQRRGLADYYTEYSIAVGATDHAASWTRP